MGAAPQLSLTDKQVRFEYLCAKFILACFLEDIHLLCFRFISTQDEDLKHFLEGRSKIDPRVKPTPHMQRLAKDFAVIKDGQFIWERTSEYERMGEIAELIGLKWGGRWMKRDESGKIVGGLNDIYHVQSPEY